MTLFANTQALAPNLFTYFLAQSNFQPVVYSVLAGGVGGSIDPSTGFYTAPGIFGVDVVQAIDAMGNSATLPINVQSAVMLFCNVLQEELDLADGRVYLWDQKINEPTDSGLFIAVSQISCKPFGNSIKYDGSGVGLNSIQSTNFLSTLTVDAISRGPDARDRKEEIIMALLSNYSESQQELNSFKIARLSTDFKNLSEIDGAAIPYRYQVLINIQYFVQKTQAIDYYDVFKVNDVIINP